MTVLGLPLHSLVLHATVVLVPLTVLLALGFALLPRWRWLTRWPAAVASVVCVGLGFLTTTSGEALVHARPYLAALVATHRMFGTWLSWVLVPFAVVTLVAAWALPGSTMLASGRGAQRSRLPGTDALLATLVVVAAVAVLTLVVLTGHSGAEAVWGQTAATH
ncbi:MAG TPA: hypothetical protein VFT75_15235 [Nocardioidaceae bacterium]|jgi:hypothetical protein|nr:hypothetical protein [Nocardioidaceae bacterium]